MASATSLPATVNTKGWGVRATPLSGEGSLDRTQETVTRRRLPLSSLRPEVTDATASTGVTHTLYAQPWEGVWGKGSQARSRQKPCFSRGRESSVSEHVETLFVPLSWLLA